MEEIANLKMQMYEDELERKSGMLLDQAKRLEAQILGKDHEEGRSETEDVRKAEPPQQWRWGWGKSNDEILQRRDHTENLGKAADQGWGKSNDEILQDKLDKAQRVTENLCKDLDKARTETENLRKYLDKARTETEDLRKAAAQQWRWRCLEGIGFFIVLVYVLRR